MQRSVTKWNRAHTTHGYSSQSTEKSVKLCVQPPVLSSASPHPFVLRNRCAALVLRNPDCGAALHTPIIRNPNGSPHCAAQKPQHWQTRAERRSKMGFARSASITVE
ncbi:hypothetical protein Tcan_00607, partial [Toxocara canis]